MEGKVFPSIQVRLRPAPLSSKSQFQLIDAQVKAGNIDGLRRNDWLHYTRIGGGYLAWGSV